MIAHQLLNSVAKLKIVCEMWDDPEAQVEQLQEETLPILQHEIDFLRHLGQDVLQLDQAAVVELPVIFEPIDLIAWVEQMLLSFRLQEQERHFESHYEPGLPPVWGDTERLQDVLNNLVSNALKYSEPASPIKISVQCDDNRARVSVTNTGSTIPPGDEKRIFSKYYRGRESRQPGLGLGLYLADHLIKQHGGRIWAESSPAENTTTFHFTLPLADETQAKPIDPNGNRPSLALLPPAVGQVIITLL